MDAVDGNAIRGLLIDTFVRLWDWTVRQTSGAPGPRSAAPSPPALAGLVRYQRFPDVLDTPSAPHQRGGEMVRLTVAGVAIAALGVTTALIIAIDPGSASGRGEGRVTMTDIDPRADIELGSADRVAG